MAQTNRSYCLLLANDILVFLALRPRAVNLRSSAMALKCRTSLFGTNLASIVIPAKPAAPDDDMLGESPWSSWSSSTEKESISLNESSCTRPSGETELNSGACSGRRERGREGERENQSDGGEEATISKTLVPVDASNHHPLFVLRSPPSSLALVLELDLPSCLQPPPPLHQVVAKTSSSARE